MSKATFAIIAAVSAATGASVTAAMLSKRADTKVQAAASSTSVSATSNTSVPAPVAVPLPVEKPIVDPAGLFQYGFPGPINDLATRHSLVSSHDRRLKIPTWVAEHITLESILQNKGDRRHSYFAEDPAVPEKYRAKLKDYQRSGYDRGHQVPAADAKWSQEAMNDTFYLTNMAPQVGEGFNRDYWAHFEDFCRRLTMRYPSVRIVTGPLFLPRRHEDGKYRVTYEMIGSPPNVAVPTHFYKVIFAEDGTTTGKVALGAFVLPNLPIPNEKPITDFEVPIEAIERSTGLEFASKLPANRRKRLCLDHPCALVIRDYADKQKAFAKDLQEKIAKDPPRRNPPRNNPSAQL
jgi:endonuclease G